MTQRLNALQQAIDIGGSYTAAQTMTIANEPTGLGAVIASGATATVGTVTGGAATVTGLTGMSVGLPGNAFLTLSTGQYLISVYNSATSVDVVDTATPSLTAGSGLTWSVNQPYSLEDDMNYRRTQEKQIKGTTNWYDAMPTYTRQGDGTTAAASIPASLTNLGTKTLDARGVFIPRAVLSTAVATSDTSIVLTGSGVNYKWSSSTDKTGVPMFGGTAPNDIYAANTDACYVVITDATTGNEIESSDNQLVFGYTVPGAQADGSGFEVKFKKVAYGAALSTAVDYTWEASVGVTSVNLSYNYWMRMDLMPETVFRSVLAQNVVSDADLRQDVNTLQTLVGTGNTTVTNISSFLTNTGNYFPFVGLTATPTVIDALNILNSSVGNRDFTGGILGTHDGESVTALLQLLANAISSSAAVRTKEIVGTEIAAGTSHLLPGSMTFTLDSSGNAQNLWVFVRGILNDAGTAGLGNDYAETDTTHLTFYKKIKVGDHINYFRLQ